MRRKEGTVRKDVRSSRPATTWTPSVPDTGAYFTALIESVGKDENYKREYTVRNTEYKGSSYNLPEQSVGNIPGELKEFNDLKVGDVVFVNYNFENPNELGFWYDAKIEGIRKTTKTVICNIKKTEGCRATHLEIY